MIDIELPDIDLPELDDPLSDEELEFLLTFKVECDPDEFGNDPLPPAPEINVTVTILPHG